MDFMGLEIVVIIGIVLDITSAFPYGEQRYWGGSMRRKNSRGVLLPDIEDLATSEGMRLRMLETLLPSLDDVVEGDTRRPRRRKSRIIGDELLSRRQARRSKLRDIFLPRLEQTNTLVESKYPDFMNNRDIPKIRDVADYMVRKDSYRGSRKTKRGRSRRTRTLRGQRLIGNTNSMDIIDGQLSSHPTSQELSLFEQLSIELARLRCQELQRQRDALRVLEMADPSNFQHRSEHREQPC